LIWFSVCCLFLVKMMFSPLFFFEGPTFYSNACYLWFVCFVALVNWPPLHFVSSSATTGEGTLPAMGGRAVETTWRRITGHLHFMVSRREEGAAATRGKGGLTECVLQQRRSELHRRQAQPASRSKDLRGLTSVGFTMEVGSAQR
jgi:hypothetical protein